MKHTKINLTLTAVLFLILLFTPILKNITFPNYAEIQFEKRRLQQFPTWPNNWATTQSYPEQFESYYKDHFGFRPFWVSQYRQIKSLIQDPVVDQVIIGKEHGWLFYNDATSDDVIGDFRNINQFTDKQLDQFVEILIAKKQWLAKQGIEYIFVLAPSKHYVYPEYLPQKYQAIEQTNLKTQLSEAIKQHPDFNYLDLTQTIIDGKTEQQMFLKNDTHWTDFATNLAQREIAAKIEKLFPDQITPKTRPWHDFTISTPHTGDLAMMNGTPNKHTEIRSLAPFKTCAETPLQAKEKFNDTFDTDCHLPLRALVFRDSFFSNLQPFVSEYLGLSRFVWQRMTYKAAQKHISEIKPDVVIEEWVDRHLPKLRAPE